MKSDIDVMMLFKFEIKFVKLICEFLDPLKLQLD